MKTNHKVDQHVNEANNRLHSPADVSELLSESFNREEHPVVANDDEVMRKVVVVIDLVRERIGSHREAAYDLRQQALDEDLAAERFNGVLSAVIGRIEVARAG